MLVIYSDGVIGQLDDGEGELRIEGLAGQMNRIAAGRPADSERAVAILSELLRRRQGDRPAEDDRTFLKARRVADERLIKPPVSDQRVRAAPFALRASIAAAELLQSAATRADGEHGRGNQLEALLMSVNAIGSSLATLVHKTASGGSSPSSSIANVAQEATETQAQTVKEAQGGDSVAKKKLLQIQAKLDEGKTAVAPKASEPGKGEAVDTHA